MNKDIREVERYYVEDEWGDHEEWVRASVDGEAVYEGPIYGAHGAFSGASSTWLPSEPLRPSVLWDALDTFAVSDALRGEDFDAADVETISLMIDTSDGSNGWKDFSPGRPETYARIKSPAEPPAEIPWLLLASETKDVLLEDLFLVSRADTYHYVLQGRIFCRLR